MKKFAILLILTASMISLESFAGPKSDAKKMIKVIKNYTAVAVEAAEDKKLDDREIEELKFIGNELIEFEKEIQEKYKDNKKGEKAINKYLEDNKAELEKVYEEFFNAMMALYACEGAEKLDFADEVESQDNYPEDDAKKMIKHVEKCTKIAKKASKDKKLNAKEIEELKEIEKEFGDIEKEMEEKYKDDSVGSAKVDKYFEENKAEFEKAYEDFYSAMLAIYECEGSENIWGPESDAKEMIKLIEGYTVAALKASEDKILDDNEIEALKILGKELEDFEKEMEEKYKDDLVGKEAVDKYLEDNKAELEKVYEEFFNAMMALYECEGSEKLE